MTRHNDVTQEIINHERRLQKLKERRAIEGRSTDPADLIEIEDIETILEELRRTALSANEEMNKSTSSQTAQPTIAQKTVPIHWPKSLQPLDIQREMIVPQLFVGKKEVWVEEEIGGGLGGARLFLVQPINKQGNRTARQIIKIGYKRELRAEYDNTKAYIEQDLPHEVPRLEHYVEWEQWAGLNYSFMSGGSLGKTQTFEAYYETASADQIIKMAKMLLGGTLNIWYSQHASYTTSFANEYGRHIAAHLRLKIRRASTDGMWLADETPIVSSAYTLLPAQAIVAEHHNFQSGDLIQIERLKIVKCKHEELKLQYSDDSGVVVKAEGPYPDTWAVGDEISVRGEVVYNRHGRLTEVMQALLAHSSEAEVDIQHEQITLAGQPYPNPLKRYPQILDQLLTSRKSTVHGDLHVRNILVDEQDRGWLIDFAKVTERHNIFDFIKLEIYLRRMILSQFNISFADYLEFEEALAVTSLGSSAPPPDDPQLQKAYEVILALRDIAKRYMGHSPDFHKEYFPALFLYGLAMLKYFAPHEVQGMRLLVGMMGVVGGSISQIEMNKREQLTKDQQATVARPDENASWEAKPDQETYPIPIQIHDSFTIYELRVTELLKRIGPQNSDYHKVYDQYQLLNINIADARQYLDTRELKIERAKIIARLNVISLSTLGISFDELYK